MNIYLSLILPRYGNDGGATGKSFAFPSWILIQNPWVERLKSTLGIMMWFAVSTVIAYHIGILDQNPMLGTRNFSLCASWQQEGIVLPRARSLQEGTHKSDRSNEFMKIPSRSGMT